MLDDKDRTEVLWQRVRAFLPQIFRKKWCPVGLNERLRFYRYDVGQQFDWHMDGYFERDNGERSFFTFMVYLNDDFDGGSTSFDDDKTRFQVKPKKGMALLFHHPITHKGEPVQRGRKYVLRTDVMYGQRLSVV
jgi:predicted 2-oxoglutarate/Fe(II)-dependent dioxygenase YbiX